MPQNPAQLDAPAPLARWPRGGSMPPKASPPAQYQYLHQACATNDLP